LKDRDYSRYEPIFGAWYITEELGSGAEGHLYRIRREDSLGHVYYSALKAMTIPAAGELELESLMAGGMSREEAEQFIRNALEETTQEFELLEKLKGNSNIASYEDHEIFKHEEDFGWDILIRMEELTPLVRYCIDNPLSPDDVTRIGIDICKALVLCSKYGVIHRDIKPENIFISEAGNYKLGDFGIARIIENTSTVLSRKGTYAYMAPEVYWGRKYGHSADLYSLGLVMYRFLNDGRGPFMPVYPEPIKLHDREEALLKRINDHKMDPPRNGSKALKDIVLRACAYDPDDRYSSADDMLHDLESLQAGLAVRHKKRRKISKLGKAALAALVLILAAGIGFYIWVPKEVEDITGPENGTMIYIGDDMSPEYSVHPDWFRNEPVTFTSSDDKILKVDDDGMIHAIKVGQAVMTMSAKGYSEDVELEVVPKVTSINGIEKNISMTTGDTLTLEPELEPEKFSSEPIKFRSKNKSVVTVSKRGVLTAAAPGEAVIKVSSGGTTFKTTVTVSDPVVYYAPSGGSGSSGSSGSKGKSSSSSSKKSNSSGGNKGYFNSKDDEHF